VCLGARLDHLLVKLSQLEQASGLLANVDGVAERASGSDWLVVGRRWHQPSQDLQPAMTRESRGVGDALFVEQTYDLITVESILTGDRRADARVVGGLAKSLTRTGTLVFADRFEIIALLREAGLIVTCANHVSGFVGPLDGLIRRLKRRLLRQPHVVCGVARPRSVFFGDSD